MIRFIKILLGIQDDDLKGTLKSRLIASHCYEVKHSKLWHRER
jgi:hypothetical protein